jgi:hypothetical protein
MLKEILEDIKLEDEDLIDVVEVGEQQLWIKTKDADDYLNELRGQTNGN